MAAPTPYSQRARRAFLAYAERRFAPQQGVAFLGGSVATGTAREGSDADGVIVLDNDAPASGTRVKKVVDGVPLDIALYNRKGLQARLERECREANPYVLETVAHGDLVSGARTSLAQSSRQLAKRLLKQGAPSLTRLQERRQQVEITELTQRLHKSDLPVERRFLGSLLMPKLAVFHLRQHQQWIGTHHKLLERLQSFDPTYAKALDKAVFTDLGQHNDALPLHRLIEQTLAPVGGLSRRSPPMLDLENREPPQRRPGASR